MEIYVNQQKIDVTLENEKTVSDVLRAFEEEFSKNGATTIGISINGQKIEAEQIESEGEKALSQDTKIEFDIISSEEIKQNLFDEAGAFRAIAEKLGDISADYQSGKDKAASLLIATLAELVNRFCQTAKFTALFPDDFAPFLSNEIGGKDFQAFFKELPDILGEFEQAISSGDTVLLGDLAEYEIRPRLEEIADAIDALKKA